MAKKKTLTPVKRAPEQVFTLRVSLDETEPSIWRRIIVPASFTLEALHSVLQIAMGWQMSHLYDFQIGKNRFAEPDDFDETPVKPVTTTIAAALKSEKSFVYNYDFGDSWRHTIVVERAAERTAAMNYPICISGENACPPEDCGGFPGFESLKQTISDPANEEFAEMMQWLGGYYSPFSFDANRINRDLLWTVDWRAEPNDQGLYIPYNAINSAEEILF